MGTMSNFIQTKSLFLENISNNCFANLNFTVKVRLSV